MTQPTDEGQKRIKKYLLENATPEVKPIPKEEKKETPKNDTFNEYEYSDNENEDDTQW